MKQKICWFKMMYVKLLNFDQFSNILAKDLYPSFAFSKPFMAFKWIALTSFAFFFNCIKLIIQKPTKEQYSKSYMKTNNVLYSCTEQYVMNFLKLNSIQLATAIHLNTINKQNHCGFSNGTLYVSKCTDIKMVTIYQHWMPNLLKNFCLFKSCLKLFFFRKNQCYFVVFTIRPLLFSPW